MSKKKADIPLEFADLDTASPELKSAYNDLFAVVKKIFEAGLNTGLEFANMAWVHRLREADSPEAIFQILKEQEEQR